MLRLPITEGNFQFVAEVNAPPNTFGFEAEVPLNFAADLLVVTVVNDVQKPWVRGGRVYQALNLGSLFAFTRNTWINLDTPTLIEVEPIGSSIIRYEPPSYLSAYTLLVAARPYVNPLG